MTARQLAGVTAIYTLLTVVMAYPYSTSPGTTIVADDPDIHLYIWTLGWDVHAFLHQPWAIFDANIYYPYPNTLAYSENLIGTAFFAAPVIWLTGNLVLAMNLANLATCVLCGTGAFFLGRSLGIGTGGAFLCGLVYAFGPPRFMKMGQVHMNAMQWIPFTLAFFHLYLDRGRRSDLLKAVGCASLQALASGHGAVMLGVAGTVVCGWRVVWGEPWHVAKRVKDFGVAGLCLLSPMAWLAAHYFAAQRDAGLVRGYGEGTMPPLVDFFTSSSMLHQALLALALGGRIPDQPTAYLFPGLLVLFMAGLALVPDAMPAEPQARPPLRQRLRVSVVALYSTLALAATSLFVAWPISVWRYIYFWPGFDFIRVPARFVVLTLLALGVLSGSAFERLTQRCTRRAYRGWTVALSVLLLGEYATTQFTGVPFILEVPAIDRWLAAQPKPFVFAEVPVPRDLGSLEREQTRAMLHSTAHWQKTVHGYSGIRPSLHTELYQSLNGFPDDPSLAKLAALGVRYVVVHTEEYRRGVWPAVEARLKTFPQLHLVRVEGDGRAYELVP